MDEDNNIVLESTLYRTLDAWIETQFPYSELDSIAVEKNGFGRYTIRAYVLDLKQPVTIGSSPNVIFTMRTGTLFMDQNFSNINHFRMDFEADETEEKIPESRKRIESFPDSAWIFAAVSLKEPADIKGLMEMENDDLSVDYAQVYAGDQELTCGINLNHVFANDPEGRRDQLSSDELKKLFLARLELLQSEDNIFTHKLGFSSVRSSGPIIYSPNNAAEMIRGFSETAEKTEGFRTRHYYVSGTKEEILKLMDMVEITNIRIVDARLYK